MDEYKRSLYTGYAADFNHATGMFDRAVADRWRPCFDYYMRDWLPYDKAAKVIDLGCGNGRIVYSMNALGYEDVAGLDISPSQVKIARQVSSSIFEGDALEHLRDPKNRYDLVFALDILEHLDKKEGLEFLALCHARLNDGGRIILQTPNGASPFVGAVLHGDFTHETCFTPDLLAKLLRRAGFSQIACREVGPVPYGYSIKSTLRALMWRGVRAGLALFNTIETGGQGQGIYSRVFLCSALK